MATAAQATTVPPPIPAARGAEIQSALDADKAERALVPAGHQFAALDIAPESPVARLPVEVEVGVQIRNFRVRNLLALEPGVLITSQWNHGEDLPLSAGNIQLAWAEFEVVDTTLAARLTRVA